MKRKSSKIQLEQIPEVQEMLAKGLFTTSLNPVRVSKPLPKDSSKFGGSFLNFDSDQPNCPACKNELLFVLQLLKRDFPTFFFQADADVVQLFRCDNDKCPNSYNQNWDHLVALRFRKLLESKKESTRLAKSVPECDLIPRVEPDYPSFWEGMFEWWGETFQIFDKKYRKTGEFDVFLETHQSVEGTKLGGFPAWQQIPNFPVCKCGKRMDFLFQLSSGGKNWGEPHEICIGDAGNIYFFVCKTCETVETRWDCG